MNRIVALTLSSTLAIAVATPLFAQKVVPAAPLMQPAKPAAEKAAEKVAEKVADKIDEKAKAIYDAGIAAVAKLGAIDFMGEVSQEAVETKKYAVTLDFGDRANITPKRLRISCVDGGKPLTTLMTDGATSFRLDFKASTYMQAGGDWMSFGGGEQGALPMWMFEARSNAAASPEESAEAPKLVAATLVGTEKLDGVDCDVVKIVHALEIQVFDEAPAEGKEPKPTINVVRLIDTLALSQKDHLPRRIVQEAVEQSGKMAMPPRTTLLTVVRADPKLAPDQFTMTPPANFTKVEVPKQEEPQLSVKTGDAAHEFALKDLAGKEVTLASLKGKVVLLDFWATWCGPCKAAMPTIQKISEEYAGKPVAVFGVNTWEKTEGAAKKYIESKKYTYGCLLAGDDLAKSYGVPGIPTLIIVGKDGKIAFAEVGLEDDTGNALRKIIDAELAK